MNCRLLLAVSACLCGVKASFGSFDMSGIMDRASQAAEGAKKAAEESQSCVKTAAEQTKALPGCLAKATEGVCDECYAAYASAMEPCKGNMAVSAMYQSTMAAKDGCTAMEEEKVCMALAAKESSTLFECAKASPSGCQSCIDTFKGSMAPCEDKSSATMGTLDATIAKATESCASADQAAAAIGGMEECMTKTQAASKTLTSCVGSATEAGDKEACKNCLSDYSAATSGCTVNPLSQVDNALSSSCEAVAGADLKAKATEAKEAATEAGTSFRSGVVQQQESLSEQLQAQVAEAKKELDLSETQEALAKQADLDLAAAQSRADSLASKASELSTPTTASAEEAVEALSGKADGLMEDTVAEAKESMANAGKAAALAEELSKELPACKDATEETEAECFKNALWAKETGIEEDREYYKDYPFLTKNSSMYDFQYVLHRMTVHKGDSVGHDCPMPCTTSPEMKLKISSEAVADEAKEATAMLKEASKDVEGAVSSDANEQALVAVEQAKDALTAVTEEKDLPQLGESAKAQAKVDLAKSLDAIGAGQDAAKKSLGAALSAIDSKSLDMSTSEKEMVETLLNEAGALQDKIKAQMSKVSTYLKTSQQARRLTARRLAAVDELSEAQQWQESAVEALKKAAATVNASAAKVNASDTVMKAEYDEVLSLMEETQSAQNKVGDSLTTAVQAIADVDVPSPPEEKKKWSPWVWVLIMIGVCCCCPLAGLCCSAFLCYESVSWLFGGDKPQKKKKRGLAAPKKASPAPPAAPVLPAQPPSFTYATPVRSVPMVTSMPYTVQAAPQAQQVVAQPATYNYPAVYAPAPAAPAYAPTAYAPTEPLVPTMAMPQGQSVAMPPPYY